VLIPRFGGQFCEQIKGLFEINFQPSRRKAAVRADGFDNYRKTKLKR
jgi:hypothetical protein